MVEQNSEMGFIRFGSRVDVFLPLDAKINVKLGDKTKGTQSIVATLK
jgi:phosphatidylserine decarboxylase